MTLRPCLACGEPTTSTRCEDCQPAHDRRTDARRGRTAARGYGARWQRLSARARRRQPWCLDCGATSDLTADHLVPDPRTFAEVQVVCRSCNAKRGPVATRGDTFPRRPP